MLDILESEAAKAHKFDNESVFTIMEVILDPNRQSELDIHLEKALDFLRAYKYQSPASTIVAFENAFISLSEQTLLWEKAFNVLEKITQENQCRSVANLRHLADILLRSNNKSQRERAFQILDKSIANQPDMPDDIFFIIELQRATSGLSTSQVRCPTETQS